MPELMISPMLDLIFLLLAFFIISTMYMTEVRTISIALPEAESAETVSKSSSLVTVKKDGSCWLDDKKMSLDAIVAEVKKIKNPLFMAKNLMLKGEDEAAVRLLENDTEKLPYYEVTRRFLLGVCYYRIGKEEQGKECMEYVIGHGNTLKCKEEAEKYVTV